MNQNILPEPSLISYAIIAVWIAPFFCYYLGIFIRKKCFSSKDSPSYLQQFLMAIPICLVIVSPLVVALQKSFGSHFPTYLFTLGIIIEHGMVMHETATKHLEDRLSGKKATISSS
jgi:hypothetical protein